MEVREPAVAYGKQKLTIEEYLEFENNNSDQRHEYYKGGIFAMSVAKVPHNIITRNLMMGLGIRLRGKTCQPFGSDMRIHILIDSKSILIEAFRLNATNHWELEEYKSIHDTLQIPFVGTSMPLAEIYERVTIP